MCQNCRALLGILEERDACHGVQQQLLVFLYSLFYLDVPEGRLGEEIARPFDEEEDSAAGGGCRGVARRRKCNGRRQQAKRSAVSGCDEVRVGVGGFLLEVFHRINRIEDDDDDDDDAVRIMWWIWVE